MIKENLEAVEARILSACERAGRKREEITLIAVSKTKPVELIREAMEQGIVDFGENKVQEMCRKIEEIKEPLRWHLIGHLQRNKVKYIVDKTCLIHSVDSFKLAEEIEKEAGKKEIICPVLVEINIGEEESKSGIQKEEAITLVRQISGLPHIRVKGLMCVPPASENPESSRAYFRQMRMLREEIRNMSLVNVDMEELSMGMTGDFEVAIEEGATYVRVGTAIFGARDYGIQ